jgi:methanogenic corrinoid protein MtbC1
MSNIADFSDDPKYTIKAVSTQTGIRPVTLRAWERRHEVLTPYRSDNRYRLYSERDIAVLRWIKNRVDAGVSISSAVSELRSITTQELWPEAIPTAPTRQPGLHTTPPAQYARRLAQALIQHDEATASDLLREAQSIFDLMTIFMDVTAPALEEIGDAWYNGRIRITTEHFASAFLRGKLLSLLQAYPSRRNAPYILVGCAPTEQHELGSLMLAILLRSHGYRVEYLGPDIPIEDLVDYSIYERPSMIVLSATTAAAALETKHTQEKLRKVRPMPVYAYGGRAYDLNPQLAEQVPGQYLGNTFEKAVQKVKDLLIPGLKKSG